MRWNCPHCGTALAVSDEKLGAHWSFSRCYQCAGFSLIRSASLNLIKIDEPPTANHFHQSEPADSIINKSNASQVAESSIQQLTTAQNALAPARSNRTNTPSQESGYKLQPRLHPSQNLAQNPTPSPLPTAQPIVKKSQRHSTHQPIIQVWGESFAESFAQQNKTSFAIDPTKKEPEDLSIRAKNLVKKHLGFHTLPAPLPREPGKLKWYQRFFPFVLGVLVAAVIVTGAYLGMEAQSFWQKTQKQDAVAIQPISPDESQTVAMNETQLAISPTEDRLEIQAMAPRRAQDAQDATLPEKTPSRDRHRRSGPSQVIQFSNEPVPELGEFNEAKPMPEIGSGPMPSILEKGLKASGAPASSPQAQRLATMIVSVEPLRANLRSGPGSEFPVVGIATRSTELVIQDWTQRWFKVVPKGLATSKSKEDRNNPQSVWIRNDLVRLLSKN